MQSDGQASETRHLWGMVISPVYLVEYVRSVLGSYRMRSAFSFVTTPQKVQKLVCDSTGLGIAVVADHVCSNVYRRYLWPVLHARFSHCRLTKIRCSVSILPHV